jgi:hypothetical protein
MTCRINKIEDGTTKDIPNHMPGWDVTFFAPKSVSIVALVHKRILQGVVDWARESLEPKAKGGVK